jgi:hypothetical protein
MAHNLMWDHTYSNAFFYFMTFMGKYEYLQGAGELLFNYFTFGVELLQKVRQPVILLSLITMNFLCVI